MNNYDNSKQVSEAIIAGSFFLAVVAICAAFLVCVTYLKPKPHKTYIVQSGYIEITPSGK